MSGSESKVVVVTGAGAGIGKACALRFASAAYHVLAVDLCEEDLQETGNEITGMGGTCLLTPGDIADNATSVKAAAMAMQEWGRIDALVANAGVQLGGELLESSEADWDRILGVNLRGAAYSAKAVLPSMIEQASGSIVFISSINALAGAAGMAIYDASKAGVLGLMRSLAIDHGRHGIRVNAVCPGNTLTDFHIRRVADKGIDLEQLRDMTRGYALLDRIAEPMEIANTVFFLASEQASFITGHSLVADGGYTITPR